MMPDIEFKANEDLMSAKELGISISKKCALTSKNLALLGALDDFYALYFKIFDELMQTSLDKGTQRKTTENELPSLTQCTA